MRALREPLPLPAAPCLRALLALLLVAGGDGLTVVPRAEWQARPPRNTVPALPSRTPTAIVHHTTTASCSTLEGCSALTRDIQRSHMDGHRWADIGYNFLVGGDGRAYEGRGWDAVGAHTHHWNAEAVGIALIGDFAVAPPPGAQTDAILALLDEGVRLGKLAADFKVAGACQLVATASPGGAAQAVVETWSHWWRHAAPGAVCTV